MTERTLDERAFDHRAVATRDRGDVEVLDAIHVVSVLALVDHREPWTHCTGREQRHRVSPEVGFQVADTHLWVRERGRERVDRPVDTGLRVEQPSGGGGIVDRWPRRLQRRVTDIK